MISYSIFFKINYFNIIMYNISANKFYNGNDQHSRTLKYLSREQENLQHISQQISSGHLHKSYAGMPLLDGYRLAEVEYKYRTSTKDLELLKNIEQNLDYIQDIYEKIFTITHELQTLALGVQTIYNQNPQVDPLLIYEINLQLQQLTQALNSRMGDSYIFSGSRSDNPAVSSLEQLPPLKNDEKLSNDYYLGDNNQSFIKINGENMIYIINADNVSIKNILTSFLMLKNFHDGNFFENIPTEELHRLIMNKAQQAKESFAQVFTNFLSKKKLVAALIKTKEQEVGYLLNLCNDLNSSDSIRQLELSAKLSQSKNKCDQIIAAHKVGLQINNHITTA